MNIAPNLIMKTILHTSLVSRLGTLEPKRHRHIAEGSKGSNKSCLLLVLNCHLDLMITRISIQKTQTLTTRRSINNLINMGEGERICWTSLIKIRVIHTHTPSAVFLKNQHWISQPLRVKDLHNKPCCQEPGYLLTDGLASLFIEAAEKLLDWLKLGIDIESVLSEFPRYTWHVRRLPCKNVPILTDELDERAFLFGIQVGTDSELLG